MTAPPIRSLAEPWPTSGRDQPRERPQPAPCHVTFHAAEPGHPSGPGIVARCTSHSLPHSNWIANGHDLADLIRYVGQHGGVDAVRDAIAQGVQ